MSPRTCDRWRCRPAFAALAAALLLAPCPAGAVVGGGPGPAAMAASSVMVLSSRGGVCSGVVLAPDIVLTAAHCASGAPEHRVHYKGADGAPVLVTPAAIVLHPGYSAGAETTRRRSVDLALLRLPSPLPPAFSAAALASGAAPKGAGITIGGWGVAQEGDGRSSGTFRSVQLSVVEPYGPGRILVWASPTQGHGGACQGDSGGPIALGTGSIVAITSWARGQKGSTCGELTQGVLVAPQRGWIDGVLSRWGRTAAWN